MQKRNIKHIFFFNVKLEFTDKTYNFVDQVSTEREGKDKKFVN